MPEKKIDFTKAIENFRDSLVSQGRIGVARAAEFAAKYAASYALWKQTGQEKEVDDLVAVMVMEASSYGIDAQASTEQALKNMLDAAVTAAL